MSMPISLYTITNIGYYGLVGEVIRNNFYSQSSSVYTGLIALQSATAGLALRSLLGPGLLGTTLLGAFIAAPICTNGIRLLTQKGGKLPSPTLHKIAHASDHLLRVAAKTVLAVTMLKIFAEHLMQRPFVSLATLMTTVKTAIFAESFLNDICDTIVWVKDQSYKFVTCCDYPRFKFTNSQYSKYQKLINVHSVLFTKKTTIVE